MNIFEKESSRFFHTYHRLPIEIDRGEGVYLFDKDGKKYLDMFAGLAVNALGYDHPGIKAAITSQIRKYIHLSNTFAQGPQIELAGQLLRLSGYEKVFLSNSGTEAMEGALKLARHWGRTRGKTNIFGLSDSFHGRTFGSLSITGRSKYREGYEPFLPNTHLIKFNDVAALEHSVDSHTLAVVLEFIQGEGGVNPVSAEYADALGRLREKYGFLIIADEIQTGVGRTGKFFGFQHHKIVPDIAVLAKALGGGLPLGAFLSTNELARELTPGSHGTTFGGNPVACAAGQVVLSELEHGSLLTNVLTVGNDLRRMLEKLKTQFPNQIVDVRGAGLMLGVELSADGTPVVEEMLRRGVLLNLTNTKVLRWLPPLVISMQNAQEAVSTLSDVFASRTA